MNEILFETNKIRVSTGKGIDLLKLENVQTGFYSTLQAPEFEIENKPAGGERLFFLGSMNGRKLLNGGTELVLSFGFTDREDLKLKLPIRYFPDSPFIRYRYELCSQNPRILTKADGKDNLRYTGFTSRTDTCELTEIQFSQFNPGVHAYTPDFDKKSGGELRTGCKFIGPVAVVEDDGHSCLLAYEHGAGYPDAYLSFDSKSEGGRLSLTIHAVKGNYYHGETIDSAHPFLSPWFHFAVCRGDMSEMLKVYRTFLFKYISENTESRKPYIYYNTWNNQERSHCIGGEKYMSPLNLERILKEIDVAHRIGVDVYVIDIGWFSRTGDWIVHPERFPDGLQKVREKLEGYGMKLGLWFNPMQAGITSELDKNHPEFRVSQAGREVLAEVLETEQNHYMCLASGYSDWHIKKMIQLHKELGVTYFKWDGISQYGCNSPLHNHGKEENPLQEREECYSFKMGLEMIRIAEEVTRRCPEVIVDFDVTECGRFMGLGFLSAGKYFLVNNGPYAMDFDLPEKMAIAVNKLAVNLDSYSNMFFFPGPARSRICRQGTKYDLFVPSILFLAHFLPDGPRKSHNNSLASLVLGGNGIWGDLLSLKEEDIQLFGDILGKYKRVAGNVVASYPAVKGFIGSSPEIHEKLDYGSAKGIVCFFTRAGGTYSYVTGRLDTDKEIHVEGADRYEMTPEGGLRLSVDLDDDDARIVFIG